ncbi:unnamed protein product [Ilex paraguariensis]|uniref:Uncharacterized protein n=1 Tax=Ilex paraguariensis TaxID=185542 RepID=A0ABC8UIH0_9AQUA
MEDKRGAETVTAQATQAAGTIGEVPNLGGANIEAPWAPFVACPGGLREAQAGESTIRAREQCTREEREVLGAEIKMA